MEENEALEMTRRRRLKMWRESEVDTGNLQNLQRNTSKEVPLDNTDLSDAE